MIPRRPGPEASLPSLLTYSPTQASTGPGTVSPPTQIERDPTCRCCDRRQLLRRSRRILRRLARSSAAAEVVPKCRATRELETATTAVVGRPGRISEVLVTSTRPNADQATHRARLGLK